MHIFIIFYFFINIILFFFINELKLNLSILIYFDVIDLIIVDQLFKFIFLVFNYLNSFFYFKYLLFFF